MNSDGEGKFEVAMILLFSIKGPKNKDINLTIAILEENKEIVINKCKEYLGK